MTKEKKFEPLTEANVEKHAKNRWKNTMLNDGGKEVVSSKPCNMAIPMQRSESLHEQVKRMVQTELSSAVSNAGFESFEEANDFDISDDPVDPTTPFEVAGHLDEDPPALKAKAHAAKIDADMASKADQGQGGQNVDNSQNHQVSTSSKGASGVRSGNSKKTQGNSGQGEGDQVK